MTVCATCGAENPSRARFCMECAAPLAAPRPAAEERKTVTTLFCDLVGFAALGEAADPEDIDAVLREYSSRARRVIQSHGGTVEKFIGDAVVGVFGVPAAHEDDPERAVRAGLRLLEALEGMTGPAGSPLQVRVGVNTGEALVRLDVDPASGCGLVAGDAVNTSARLQAAAPPGGVAVGALTHELTARVIVYEDLPPIVAKGRAEPVAAWRAKAPVARRGLDTDAAGLSPFVGREVELAYLTAMFDKASAQASPQFALLVGEPGIGKSRLVRELLAYVDSRPSLTTWRQGYCPPFGEDLTYWALAEVVKGHAGIRDTDDHAALETKLAAVAPPGADSEWFLQRLRALVGLPAPDAAREENFTAWMRFFEEIAAAGPTVVVLEDLHWADEALLAFLDYLTTHLSSVPLLMVGTARPELFARAPGFAAGGQVNRVGLEGLSRAATARLVSALLSDRGGDAAAVGQVVERCDGNPFFAEQSARLLAAAGGAQLPDSVQAVIAARLDVLPADQKAVLGDAAVVGSVFWDGAVAAMGAREPRDLEAMLSGLLERRLIRRIRESSMEGEREFAFAHALARDVAYGQLPRGARARRHEAVADWLQGRARESTRDLAELLAMHLTTAYELAQAVHDDDLAASVSPRAVSWLQIAGDSAQSVDVAAARRHYERALTMAAAEGPERARLLLGLGEALLLGGEYHAAADALEQAIEPSLTTGEEGSAVKPMVLLDVARRRVGIPSAELRERALALARAGPPSDDLLSALDAWAKGEYFRSGDPRVFLRAFDEAQILCHEHDLEMPVDILANRGNARCALGDLAGLDDYRRALEIAEYGPPQRTRGVELARLKSNYGILVDQTQGPSASVGAYRDCIEFCERRGMLAHALIARGALLEARLTGGDWADLPTAHRRHVDALSRGAVALMPPAQAVDCLLNTWLGAMEGLEQAVASLEARTVTFSPAFDEPYVAVGVAAADLALGRPQAAERVLRDWATTPQPASTVEYAWMVPEAVRVALRCSGPELADRLRHRGDGPLPVQKNVMASVESLLAEARGEYEEAAAGFADAAARWHAFGVPYEEGHALLGQGRCLVALGRAPEAAAPLAAAREIFARLGAEPALAETDEWLPRT